MENSYYLKGNTLKDQDFFKDIRINSFHKFDPLQKALFIDIKTWLADNLLMKIDKMAMFNSLEARVPYLDHRLVELAINIPSNYKISGNNRKFILRTAFKNLVPKEILKRKKQGFNLPLDDWIRTGLKEFVNDSLTKDYVKKAGICDENYVTKLVDRHMAGTINAGRRIWTLLCFHLFLAKKSCRD